MCNWSHWCVFIIARPSFLSFRFLLFQKHHRQKSVDNQFWWQHPELHAWLILLHCESSLPSPPPTVLLTRSWGHLRKCSSKVKMKVPVNGKNWKSKNIWIAMICGVQNILLPQRYVQINALKHFSLTLFVFLFLIFLNQTVLILLIILG